MQEYVFVKKQIVLIIALSVILEFATTNVSAATDYAMNFNDESQGIQVKHSDTLNLNSSLTIEAWIYAEPSIYDAYYNFIISKNMNDTGYGIDVFGWNAESKLIVFGGGSLHVQNDLTLPTNQWIHIAVAWDGKTIRLYLNGLLAAENAAELPLISNNFDLFIGHSPFGGDLNWRGKLDEVRIWNISRTQAEVYQDMYTKPAKTQKGIVAYWDFNETLNSGVVTDKSGNKNNGVLIGNGFGVPKRIKSDRPSLLTHPIN
jgi:hypothetical protein